MAIRVRQSEELRVRIEHLFWFLTVCYLMLVARLVYLQVINGQFYRDKAKGMRAQHIPLPSERGAILDRHGRPLAVTTHRSIVTCDPTQVKDGARTAEALSRVLALPTPKIAPFLKYRETGQGRPVRSVVLPFSVGPDALERFRLERSTKAGAANLNGIFIVTKQERAYPVGRDTVHLVGMVSPDDNGILGGRMGLEQSQDAVLRGEDGFVEAEVDVHRRVIPDTQVARREAANGLNVRLTLDADVQHIAETELSNYCLANKPLGATAIVMNPKTGDVLAMVSYPDFDPIKREELKLAPADLQSVRSPLMNRAVSLLEPGSTMKIITAAAALQDKVITKSTTWTCNGEAKIGSRTVKCAAHNGHRAHGTLNIRGVISQSCNVSAGQIGVLIGMDRMRSYLQRFGLLEPTGVGLVTDPRGRLGFGADESVGGISKVSRVAFGQSVMVTPLAMIAAYAAIANDGMLMRPRLIQSYEDSEGHVVRRVAPAQVRQAVAPETAGYLRELLEAVVSEGTGKGKASVPGYTVAGKTGTAQKVVEGQRGYASGKYVASFVGFIPARQPKAVIYVVVDEPSGAYYGAQVAAPIFQGIARRLMLAWHAAPDDPAGLQKARIARK